MTCFTTPPPPPKCPHQRPPRTPCPPRGPMGEPRHSTPSVPRCPPPTTARIKTLGAMMRRRGHWWWRILGITPQSSVSPSLWEPHCCFSMYWLSLRYTTARTSGGRTPAMGSLAPSARPPPMTLATTHLRRRSCRCR